MSSFLCFPICACKKVCAGPDAGAVIYKPVSCPLVHRPRRASFKPQDGCSRGLLAFLGLQQPSDVYCRAAIFVISDVGRYFQLLFSCFGYVSISFVVVGPPSCSVQSPLDLLGSPDVTFLAEKYFCSAHLGAVINLNTHRHQLLLKN